MKEIQIAIVGDAHLNSTKPISRLDDYPETCLRKISEIGIHCVRKGIEHIVLLGDVWHKNQQSITYINKVIKLFDKLRRDGLKVHSIIGNHELSFEKIENLERSPLQTMFVSGVLNHLKTLDLGEVVLHGFDYPEELTKAPDNGKYNVCVAHRFYNYNLSEYTLREKHVKHLGYSAMLLGHDHQIYDPLRVGETLIIRPGSLMRGTTHSYNLTREPSFDILKVDRETYREIVETITIPHLPAREVFTTQSLVKNKKDDTDLLIASQQMDELIAVWRREQPPPPCTP